MKALHTRDRRTADDPAFSELLTTAGGVWFGGGRQWRFVDAYEGTLTERRFHEVLARGGAVGGSSAGASIQGEYMPRGHPLGNTVVAAEGYERGFGFLPGVAVDQHFFARKRTADMTGLMKLYPHILGVGIDIVTWSAWRPWCGDDGPAQRATGRGGGATSSGRFANIGFHRGSRRVASVNAARAPGRSSVNWRRRPSMA